MNNSNTTNITIPTAENTDNAELGLLIDKLTKSNITLNEDIKTKELVNNPNYLLLIENIINSINIDSLNTIEKDFFFNFLTNIHSRLFIALKLGFFNLEINNNAIVKFTNLIEIKLKSFSPQYTNILQSFDDIIDDIQITYEQYIKKNNNSNDFDLLSTIIIDGMSKITKLNLSLLNKEHKQFLNELSTSYKLKIEYILDLNLSISINTILQDKLGYINDILDITTESDNIMSNNNIILKDTLTFLIYKFGKLLETASNAVILDNLFTESFLSALEKIPKADIIEDIHTKIGYILLNIIDTRELALDQPKHKLFENNIDYRGINTNTNFVQRAIYLNEQFNNN